MPFDVVSRAGGGDLVTAPMKLGFVGLGAMGEPMSALLAAAGYPMVVFDIDAPRTGVIADRLGATAASHLKELAGCDVVITMLPDSPAVNAVVAGPDGLCDHLEPGALF